MVNSFSYGGATVLSHPLVVEVLLPFILIFTLVFAMLQKSKVLGDGKKQIDAIVALVIGLIVVSFANAVGIILQLIPFLAVCLVIILVFLVMWGSVFEAGKFSVHKNVQWALGGVFAIAVIIAVLIFTGAWTYIMNLFTGGSGSDWVTNIVIILVLIGVVAAVLAGSPKGGSSGGH